ncbi:MAG: PKD domain-containing protein [Saprospiraceae bacterium]|nr:PKD domain-containing protein [Saprospiraceae bacterium]
MDTAVLPNRFFKKAIRPLNKASHFRLIQKPRMVLSAIILSLACWVLPNPVSAQTTQIQIIGPSEICLGQCVTYFAEGISNPNIPLTWNLLLANGSIQSGTGNTFTFCPEFSGWYFLELYGFGVGGQQAILLDAQELIVFPFVNYQIFSDVEEVCPAANNQQADPNDCETVCTGSTVSYFLTGTPGGASNFVSWSVFGAESYVIDPSLQRITVTWGAPGNGSISVFAQDSVCPGEASLCVEILPDPVASFETLPPASGDTLRVCKGQEVQFQNTSQNATSYLWKLGDATAETTNIAYTFSTPGVYEVTLFAYNACLCSDTTSLFIEVLDAENPGLDCIGTVCEGETVTYTSDATCSSFLWNVSANGNILGGGGAGDNFITINWPTGPVGTIELEVSNCSNPNVCQEPTIATIPVLSDNAEISGPDRVCKGETSIYSLPEYEGTTFNWTVSNFGTIVAGAGTHEITVEWFGGFLPNQPQLITVEYDNCYLGCGGSDSLVVNIRPEFIASGPIEVCPGEAATYTTTNLQTNTAFAANWTARAADGTVVWSSSSATPSAVVNWPSIPGTYTLSVVPDVLADYCGDAYNITVTLAPLPAPLTAIAGESTICPGLDYTYTAEGVSPAHSVRWEVNNGGTTTTFYGNPLNVLWANTGPYEIAAVQINNNGPGCASGPINFTAQPIAPFTLTGAPDVCEDQTSLFAAPAFSRVKYDWTITPAGAGTITGNPDSSTVEILWHRPGPAIVQLALCNQTATFNVEVRPKPRPEVLHPAELCPNTTATVQTTTPFDSYVWENENGNTLSQASTADVGPGYYLVTVENQYGCIGDTTFYVDGFPESQIFVSTPSDPGFCPNGPLVTLYATSSTAGYSYQWFHNNVPVGTDAPTYDTNEFGGYVVRITDVNGCQYLSNMVLFYECCAATGVCSGGGGGGSPGGGSSSACVPGTEVQMTINPTSACNTSDFVANIPNLVPGTIEWHFADPLSGANNFSNILNPSHTYSRAGFYRVWVRAQTQVGANPQQLCWDLKVDTAELAAAFEWDGACPGAPIEFFDLSTFLPIASIASWSWDFGDPASGADNTSTATDPTHIFANPGTYTVTLTVTSSTGCTSTLSQQLEVFAPPTVSFDDPPVACEKTAIPFVALTSSNATYVEWDFGDPVSGDANRSEAPESYHLYETPGTYAVTLFAQNIYGCLNSYSANVDIEPNPLTGNISLSVPSPLCEGDVTTLTAPPGGTMWAWSDSTALVAITVGVTGVYDVSITNADGCRYSPPAERVDVIPAPQSAIRAVEYNRFLQPIAYFYENYEACEGTDVFLQTIGGAQYSYQWSTGETTTEIEFSEDRGNQLPAGVHDVFLTVTDLTNNCTNVMTFSIIIHALPAPFQISASQAGLICEGNPTTFSVVNPVAANTYEWNNGVIGTSTEASLSGEYFATAINEFGCEQESNHLEIAAGPNISLIPSGCHTRCRPDTLCFAPVPGVISYQWYFEGAPIPGGNVPNVIVDQSGSYYVEMTNSIGCTLSSDPLVLDLYDGFGTLEGAVYYDVNNNGIIDAADTTVSNVTIQLSNAGGPLGSTVSSSTGSYAFANQPAPASYTLNLDTLNLPGNYDYYDAVVDTSLAGCDVIVGVNWLLRCAQSTSSLQLSACTGSTVDYNGTPLAPGAQQDFTFAAVSGCDSVVTVTVLEIPPVTSSLQLSACTGSTVTYNNTALSPGAQQSFTFAASNGCDSVVTVTVSEILPVTSSLQLSACTGSTVTYNNTALSPGAQQSFTFAASSGCDSVVTVTVSEILPVTSSLQLSACTGSTVTYNNTALSPGAQQSFTFAASNGCDSVVTVTVSEILPVTSSLQLSACTGGTVTYNNTALSPGAQQSFTFAASSGCDSVVTVTVSEILPVTSSVQLNACTGGTVTYNNTALSPGVQQSFTFAASSGCDSVVTVTVVALPEVSFDQILTPGCPNGANGSISFSNVSGSGGPYVYSIDGGPGQLSPDFTGLTAGSHVLEATDVNGCSDEATVTLTALESLTAIVQNAALPCDATQSGLVAVQVLSGDDTPLTYLWQDGSVAPALSVTQPGSYPVTITNACESVTLTATAEYEAIGDRALIYMPNAFSPNADGINDEFMAFINDEALVETFELFVFDRWGNLLLRSDDPNARWDGAFKNKVLKQDVYVWRIKARIQVCGQTQEIVRHGDVMLVR